MSCPFYICIILFCGHLFTSFVYLMCYINGSVDTKLLRWNPNFPNKSTFLTKLSPDAGWNGREFACHCGSQRWKPQWRTEEAEFARPLECDKKIHEVPDVKWCYNPNILAVTMKEIPSFWNSFRKLSFGLEIVSRELMRTNPGRPQS